jgi:hypothetical protein
LAAQSFTSLKRKRRLIHDLRLRFRLVDTHQSRALAAREKIPRNLIRLAQGILQLHEFSTYRSRTAKFRAT